MIIEKEYYEESDLLAYEGAEVTMDLSRVKEYPVEWTPYYDEEYDNPQDEGYWVELAGGYLSVLIDSRDYFDDNNELDINDLHHENKWTININLYLELNSYNEIETIFAGAQIVDPLGTDSHGFSPDEKWNKADFRKAIEFLERITDYHNHLLTRKSYVFPDGRELMCSPEYVKEFFIKNTIVGKRIKNILPGAYDYILGDLGKDDYNENAKTFCGIDTDEPICLVFEDGHTLEVEVCGDGPVILGFDTAELNKYPKPDGSCYTLHTLFSSIIGQKITEIKFEKTNKPMQFPSFCGKTIQDEEHVYRICFLLEDGNHLIADGCHDFFSVSLKKPNGEYVYSKMAPLMAELNNPPHQLDTK